MDWGDADRWSGIVLLYRDLVALQGGVGDDVVVLANHLAVIINAEQDSAPRHADVSL